VPHQAAGCEAGAGQKGWLSHADRIWVRSCRFIFAFAKNERENIGDAELVTLREIAGLF
jgi:hypothetical protein